MTVDYEGEAFHRHDWDPFVVQFSENFGIRWYGLAYVFGFLTAAWLLSLYYKRGKSPFNKDQQYNVLLFLVAGTMLGGRLGYMLLYDMQTLLSAPWKIIQVWKGGMASHGGIAGIVAACLYLGYRYKQSLWKVGDIVVTLGPAGILFGRLANYINGELWGKISTVPWAVVFPDASPAGVPRHPSQLYEAALEGLFMLVYLQARFWRSGVTERKPGQLTGEFFVLYPLVRILGEQFREPDVDIGPILGMSRGIFYSIIMLLVGVGFIIRARRKSRPEDRGDSEKD